MTEETNQQSSTLTAEEMEAKRLSIIKHYNKQIELAKLQAEYEKYLADIEESRARRMNMIIRQAQMANPQEEPSGSDESEKIPENPTTKERTLKK